MRVSILAVGRMKSGPEAELVTDYLDRFGKSGRPVGLTGAALIEVEAKKGGMAAEATLLEKALGNARPLVVLDERGKLMTSPEFAEKLGDWRDQGISEVGFVVGGADGKKAR